MDIKKLKSLFFEIMRFGIVGVISFFADSGTMLFFTRFVFKQPQVNPDSFMLAVAVSIGFAVGVTVNYLLSVFFVFTAPSQKGKGRDLKSMVLFLAIALVGLLMTNVIILVLCSRGMTDIFAKIIATVVVMVWNYVSRKLLIFK